MDHDEGPLDLCLMACRETCRKTCRKVNINQKGKIALVEWISQVVLNHGTSWRSHHG